MEQDRKYQSALYVGRLSTSTPWHFALIIYLHFHMWIEVKKLISIDFSVVVQGKWSYIMEPHKVRILWQNFHLPYGVRIHDTSYSRIFVRTFHIPVEDATAWRVTMVQNVSVLFFISVSLTSWPQFWVMMILPYIIHHSTHSPQLLSSYCPSLVSFPCLGYCSSFLTTSKLSAAQ